MAYSAQQDICLPIKTETIISKELVHLHKAFSISQAKEVQAGCLRTNILVNLDSGNNSTETILTEQDKLREPQDLISEGSTINPDFKMADDSKEVLLVPKQEIVDLIVTNQEIEEIVPKQEMEDLIVPKEEIEEFIPEEITSDTLLVSKQDMIEVEINFDSEFVAPNQDISTSSLQYEYTNKQNRVNKSMSIETEPKTFDFKILRRRLELSNNRCNMTNKMESTGQLMSEDVTTVTNAKACGVMDCSTNESHVPKKRRKSEKKRERKGPFTCNYCNKICEYKCALIEHIRMHTGEKPFTCDVCDATFAKKFNLKFHKLSHLNEKPFSCNVCDVKFSKKGNLAAHMKSHSDERYFSCQLCKATFKQNSSLTRHMRTHTGEKLYACGVCPSKFTHKSTLNNHLKVHTGEKPFSCELCQSKFSRRTALNKHMKTHTGEA